MDEDSTTTEDGTEKMVDAIDIDDIGGIQEVADALGVGVFRARRWVERRALTNAPEPIKRLKMGPVYSISHWRGWFALWRITRGSETWRQHTRGGSTSG